MGRLYLALGNYLAAHPDVGRVFFAPLDVVFTLHDIVEPDLLFVAGDQTSIMTEKNIQGAPAIVVKRELFDRGGVREYWLVDPDRRGIVVHRREGNRLDARTWLSAAEHAVLTTPLIPGFSLSVSDLFRPSV